MAFPATYNFSYYRGDTFEFNITPKDTAGNLFVLTSYSSVFTVADERGDGGTQVICYSTTDSTNNVIRCAIRVVDRQDIDFPSGTQAVYDVQIFKDGSPYDFVYTLLTGTITITEDVSGPVAGAS
jgi:hypothetical protein